MPLLKLTNPCCESGEGDGGADPELLSGCSGVGLLDFHVAVEGPFQPHSAGLLTPQPVSEWSAPIDSKKCSDHQMTASDQVSQRKRLFQRFQHYDYACKKQQHKVILKKIKEAKLLKGNQKRSFFTFFFRNKAQLFPFFQMYVYIYCMFIYKLDIALSFSHFCHNFRTCWWQWRLEYFTQELLNTGAEWNFAFKASVQPAALEKNSLTFFFFWGCDYKSMPFVKSTESQGSHVIHSMRDRHVYAWNIMGWVPSTVGAALRGVLWNLLAPAATSKAPRNSESRAEWREGVRHELKELEMDVPREKKTFLCFR